jgi:hypothetical protein
VCRGILFRRAHIENDASAAADALEQSLAVDDLIADLEQALA